MNELTISLYSPTDRANTPEGSIISFGIIPMEVPRMVAPYPSGTNTDFVQLHVAIHAPGRRRPGT